MPRIVNVELISNPVNWVIVILMILIGSALMNCLLPEEVE